MGIGSNWAVEVVEERYLEAKEKWIRECLGDDASENSAGWDELSDAFDEGYIDDTDYDDWAVQGKSRIEIFDETVEITREILDVRYSSQAAKSVLVMIHGHVVAAVEAYLSSTFIDATLSSEKYIRRLVESDPEFAKRKFTIKEIFTKKEALRDDVGKYLQALIFHNIDKVGLMYKSVLNIDFGEVKWLFEAVVLRHHCVHRAGYDKDGNEVDLETSKVEDLIIKCSQLVHDIELSIQKLPQNGEYFWKT